MSREMVKAFSKKVFSRFSLLVAFLIMTKIQQHWTQFGHMVTYAWQENNS